MITTDVGAERILGFAARMQKQLDNLLGLKGSLGVASGEESGSSEISGDGATTVTAETKQEGESRGTDSPAAAGSGASSEGVATSVSQNTDMKVVQKISLPSGQTALLTPGNNETYVSCPRLSAPPMPQFPNCLLACPSARALMKPFPDETFGTSLPLFLHCCSSILL